ncbi:hypothetical protein OHD16_06750 [Sphingobacterium sp. ML3W]|uniref:hypothetical protein n=1 Tax=Sphingobacterium sp. ML3W TaxID=1538644 RepID=UPI00249B5253|nr:hypothetical protein [Sphingobacterium sp. ML3W]WFA79668.1 hypothetical protein OGI71_26990 [Sphingobacterium sp. ML3W]
MLTTIFPRKDFDCKICDYRYGKRFAIQQNTDSGLNYPVDTEPGKQYANFQMYQSFKYGMKYTMFSNSYNPGGANSIANIDYVNMCGSGIVELQHYFSTDKWINPVTGVDELIPDHIGSVWTSLGATYFNVTAGDSKPTLYPNHGQQLYDISGGKYGYDVVNGVSGLSNLSELKGIKSRQTDWVDSLGIKSCSVFSYRNGRNMSPEVYKQLYLMGRQSNPNNAYFYYGNSKFDETPLGNDLPLSRTNQVNRSITTRWVDSYISSTPGAKEAANNLVRNKITEAYNNRGAYTDFSHHHSAGSNQMLEDLFKTIGEHLDAMDYRKDCWISGFGDLAEYFWFRQLTKRAVATNLGDRIQITLEWNDLNTVTNGLSDDVLLTMLKTPLSIEIDLTGTFLAGKTIKTSYGKILSLGSDKYIVELSFYEAYAGIKCLVIQEGQGEFYDTTVISASYSKIGSNVTVTVNKNVRAVLMSTADTIYNMSALLYSNTLSKSHTFLLDSTKITFIGVVDELGATKLIEIV